MPFKFKEWWLAFGNIFIGVAAAIITGIEVVIIMEIFIKFLIVVLRKV
jgi:hypothetical protein